MLEFAESMFVPTLRSKLLAHDKHQVKDIEDGLLGELIVHLLLKGQLACVYVLLDLTHHLSQHLSQPLYDPIVQAIDWKG